MFQASAHHKAFKKIKRNKKGREALASTLGKKAAIKCYDLATDKL